MVRRRLVESPGVLVYPPSDYCRPNEEEREILGREQAKVLNALSEAGERVHPGQVRYLANQFLRYEALRLGVVDANRFGDTFNQDDFRELFRNDHPKAHEAAERWLQKGEID